MILVVRETHDTPENVARRLERAGGVNRFGEANYRAVWGWNRLAWIGGKFEDRDEHGALLRECIELRKEPYVSGGTQRSMCQRFTAGYFGSFLSSMHSRNKAPCSSRSSNFPPIQARRFQPHTAR